MLQSGAAWTYTKYQDDSSWLDLEKKAQQKKLGLWKNTKAVEPWKWREQRKP